MRLRGLLAATVRSIRRERGASMMGSMAVAVVKRGADTELGLIDLVWD